MSDDEDWNVADIPDFDEIEDGSEGAAILDAFEALQQGRVRTNSAEAASLAAALDINSPLRHALLGTSPSPDRLVAEPNWEESSEESEDERAPPPPPRPLRPGRPSSAKPQRRLHEDAPRASPGATHPSFKERLALLADAGDRWWQAYKSSMEAWELTWGHGAR